MSALRERFRALSQRDQLSLVVLGIALLLYLCYRLLWLPVADQRAAVERQNRVLAETLLRVDLLSAQLQRAGLAQGVNDGPSAASLTAVVSQTAPRFGVRVARLQPNSRGELEVRLDDAPLPGLLRWLHHLEQEQAVTLIELSTTQTASAGRVNATFRLGAAL
jgi:general secretion pathway protein M